MESANRDEEDGDSLANFDAEAMGEDDKDEMCDFFLPVVNHVVNFFGTVLEMFDKPVGYRVEEDELEALIFDCDGTLVDTMPAYYKSWTMINEKYGLELSEERFYSLAGVPVKDIIKLMIDEAGKTGSLTVDEVFKSKCEFGERAIAEVGTPRIECVCDVARKYKNKIPLAVASSGNREHVLSSLRDNGILDLFDAVITCEDVSNPKPAPDIYLLAAKRLGVDPTKCRGFEDGEVGMQSLRAAGMEAVFVCDWEGYPRSSSQLKL